MRQANIRPHGTTWGAGTVYVKWTRLEPYPLAVTFWQLVIAFLVIAGCLIAVDGRFTCAHRFDAGGCVRRYSRQRRCLRNVV